tara:strand:- start:30 stop:506 length:477 start_codon:yes stop_codon:yes gene_type:complete
MKKIIAMMTAASFFFSTVAVADEPEVVLPETPAGLSLNLDLRVTDLSEGAVAPFSGILLTGDAMTKIQYDHALRLAIAESNFNFSLQRVQLQLGAEQALRLSERTMHEEIFQSQLRRIESLEEIAINKRPDWVLPVAILTSFVVGASVTVGITYAVNQ